MTEHNDTNKLLAGLAAQVERYRAEVQEVVKRGIEHPRYELKRSVTISRDHPEDRFDFIRLVQGLANAHIAEERFIVIGADEQQRKFCAVSNADEFDPADLSQVLEKYLFPLPRIEVFKNVQSDDGSSYVLIAFSPDQPRPIVIVTEGRTKDKVYFRVGDIWIKKDTRLQPASRDDLNAIYEAHVKSRVDEEAENRARRRFDHFREEFGSSLGPQPVTLTARPELLIGARENLWRFVEAAISEPKPASFKMLLEMARERLVDRWDGYEMGSPSLPADLDKWISEVADFYRNEFLPVFESTVDLGLRVIKYDGSPKWVGEVVDHLIEAFEVPRQFERLKSLVIGQRPEALSFARPAYDIYIGLRALATYAVMRKKYQFLRELLPRFVRSFTPDSRWQAQVPIIFWPFSGLPLPDMSKGRNQVYWSERIQSAWGHYFGTFDKFLAAASQLEFILEFNSYIFEGIQHAEVTELKKHQFANKYFAYHPDFWTNRLDPVVPMAEHFYDVLSRSAEFPPELSIEKQAVDAVLKGRGPRERVQFLGQFLAHLRAWQGQVMMQQNRFPFMFEWQGRLKEAVDSHRLA